jgi:deazaflavin-dependent oxidoreductase (nitroreductase family)
MDEKIQQALEHDRVIDITTTGRKSGQLRRIEIWFHRVKGHLYITGTPGERSWYANLRAHPEFTFHLKDSAQADLPARARPIENEAERRKVLAAILQSLEHSGNLDDWVKDSPLVEVILLDPPV